ncbi:MAG: type IV conjugative transfer system lipoprotein TraV [Acinetobacter sp.]|uniref:type IV conjugative transfer system lipoprotein TraV n=1 Tax=Acinetobacter sp. TaxID=472 RepID=UPI00261B07E2|nr:type IV conjugative transfer system lipoprotein TraV [Acinetobacter sp.]MDD2944313.1 type IV conjugative transfer system lipoprotein TraV [Acinetobacter sp.]
MKKLNLLALTALSTVLTACMSGYGSNYGCKGLPDGIVCKSPTQIYDMTNDDSFGGVYQSTLNEAQDQGNESDSGMFKSSKSKKTAQSTPANDAINLFSKPQFQSSSSPMPVLEQPKVLRIWVAPWKDQNETLNWGNYMFTEITPRRWNFGDSVMRNTPVTAPNEADYKSPSETQPQTLETTRDAAATEAANIRKAIDNQENPQPVKQAPLSDSMQKQNQLADEGGM